MQTKCKQCGSDTRFRARIGGWSPSGEYFVYECPVCHHVDWNQPFRDDDDAGSRHGADAPRKD